MFWQTYLLACKLIPRDVLELRNGCRANTPCVSFEMRKVMKKLMVCASFLAAALLMGGCATVQPVGVLVTQVKLPNNVADGLVPRQNLKKGTAECKSYLALVAMGDASIDMAAKNGGITKIHYVDWDVTNFLGIIGTYNCTVYGE